MKEMIHNKLIIIKEEIEKLKMIYDYKISMLQQNILIEANGIKDIKRIKRLIVQLIKDKNEFTTKLFNLLLTEIN